MSLRLEGKVAFVTGAAQGIGRAIAEKLAREGASVVVADLLEGAGARAASQIAASGLSALAVRTDITDEDSVRAAIEATLNRFGQLDILVNNAGTTFFYDATRMTSSEWDDALGVDLKGAWLCCKYALPQLELGRGVIVNIASVHATMTTYGMFPYAVAKSGLVGMTRSLALDWGRRGVRVVAVSPGWVGTPLVEDFLNRQEDPEAFRARVLGNQPLGRIAAPAEIANLVAFVASDEASYLTGTEIVIDGGLSARFAE